ncbi:MAG: transcription elongation factor GreA [Patescibacteria group bacterium]|nr:transcription elongation factor GreA [Patescibacteria group bacterium]
MYTPRRTSDIFRKKENSSIYLTQDGFRRLKEKLARLKASLPSLITETARTAAYGDRSENAEYKEAKSTLRRTHGQIFNIENRLKYVQIITEGRNATGTVRIGSTVVFEKSNTTDSTGSLRISSGSPSPTNPKQETGIKRKFQIVGPHEANPDKGRISYLSPIGAALMQRKQGDVVAINTERGIQGYRIIEIQ